jgi:hypothetical protein
MPGIFASSAMRAARGTRSRFSDFKVSRNSVSSSSASPTKTKSRKSAIGSLLKTTGPPATTTGRPRPAATRAGDAGEIEHLETFVKVISYWSENPTTSIT